MAKRITDFPETVRRKCLLWCDRRCCLCKKACGIDIIVHHIVRAEQGGTNTMDNAIPLCYECHARVEHYNAKHPLGSRISPQEQKERREQVYEEFTRHLVPPVEYGIYQEHAGKRRKIVRRFPDVGFRLAHAGPSLPVRVSVRLNCFLGNADMGPPRGPYYRGKKLWRLNPLMAHHGHFKLPAKLANQRQRRRLMIAVSVTIIDCYERHHELLTNGFVFLRSKNVWYFEP